ncbi:MAG: hypothetical protein HDQ97_18425 [Lachnospiraceae bacterium]|nr:hypothetical protein [Lachnospiraceae bacterium]
MKNKTYNRKKIVTIFFACIMIFGVLAGRLVYLMVFQSDYYMEKAKELHERERSIKAARGRILDVNGTVIADNKTVCTISVIHNQIKDPDQIVEVLCRELDLSEEYVRKRVEKYSSIEKIKSNVDKEIGDAIRAYNLEGVKVDEDYKRYYPYDSLASKVLGFTGGDNQGIIGLEVKYEEYLKGEDGMILTVTDAKGVELDAAGEERVEPIAGNDLYTSLDMNIQSYATQLAKQVMETKQADRVSIIVMNPQNGEIMAMVDVPEFNLNEPYTLTEEIDTAGLTEEKKQELLNGMWRNGCISDTYEPGSTFKIVTAAAGLEGGVVTTEDQFSCPGYIMVEDRKIRCHKIAGHGAENFVQATMNSCNPMFMERRGERANGSSVMCGFWAGSAALGADGAKNSPEPMYSGKKD